MLSADGTGDAEGPLRHMFPLSQPAPSNCIHVYSFGGPLLCTEGWAGGGAAGSGYLETPCGIDILSLCLHLLILSAARGPAFRIWVYKGSCRNANCPPPAPEAFAVAGGTCLFCTNCCALLLGSLF